MKWRAHTHLIGCIVTNLQAIETVLRYFLLRFHKQEVDFPKVSDADANETYLTNFVSLGDLINEFNSVLEEPEKQFAVDAEVVLIRDAIAHGRLLTKEGLPYRLWKFGRPKDGRVQIEFCQELNVQWLTGKSNLIDRQRQSVVDCFKARGYEGLR